MAEILASLDDINTELPSDEVGASSSEYPMVVTATDDNSNLLQIAIARTVRAYLSGTVDSVILMGWNSPANTPETIRVAAAKLIAAQLYFNQTARTSLTIDELSFAQKRYNEGMDILNKIISGEIILGAEVPTTTPALTVLDFHPTDDTDRAFTMGMEL